MRFRKILCIRKILFHLIGYRHDLIITIMDTLREPPTLLDMDSTLAVFTYRYSLFLHSSNFPKDISTWEHASTFIFQDWHVSSVKCSRAYLCMCILYKYVIMTYFYIYFSRYVIASSMN